MINSDHVQQYNESLQDSQQYFLKNGNGPGRGVELFANTSELGFHH